MELSSEGKESSDVEELVSATCMVPYACPICAIYVNGFKKTMQYV